MDTNYASSPQRELAPQTDSQFLALPPELRNRIYEMVFRLPPDDRDHVMLSDSPMPTGTGHSVLKLLETCRQINKEALGLFYTLNRLRVGCRNGKAWQATLSFLYSLGEPRRKLIKHLAVSVSSKHNRVIEITLQRIQQQCPNLTSLRIHILDAKVELILRVLSSALRYSECIMAETLPCFGKLQRVEIRHNPIVIDDNVYNEQSTAGAVLGAETGLNASLMMRSGYLENTVA